MAWTEPRTWTDGAAITADDLNEQVRDNLDAVSEVHTYTPQLLSVPGPSRTSALQGVFQSVGSDSYGRYVVSGDVVYFDIAIFPTGNTWTDPLSVATNPGAGFCVITTPTDVGVLLDSRTTVSWGQGICMEAGRLDMDSYQDFTGRNGLTFGWSMIDWLKIPFFQNPAAYWSSYLSATSSNPILIAGTYLTADAPVVPGT